MKIEYSYINTYSISDYIFSNRNSEIFLNLEELKTTITSIIDNLPSIIVKRFDETGWTLHITNVKELEKIYNLDYNIEGITDFEQKIIYIYARKDYIYSAIMHEFGHFIDWYLGYISFDIRWENIFNTYKEIMTKDYMKKIKFSSLFADLIENDLLNSNIATSEAFSDIMSIYLAQSNTAIPNAYKLTKNDISYLDDLFIYMERCLLCLEYQNSPTPNLALYNHG